jgi:D-glycero-D-manno-heptose 1,7-bisphosphate phosphatase
MNQKAVFLDRDGTIIEDTGYLGDPNDVKLLPGSAEAIRRLAQAGHLIVMVSNQSGVARGLFDEAAVSRVHARLVALLAAEGAKLDGSYYCPYLSEATVEAYRRDSDLRKPKPGMLHQASRKMAIDLSRSWMVGDSRCDVEAGRRAGCRTILVGCKLSDTEIRKAAPLHRVFDLREAAKIIEGTMAEVKKPTTQAQEAKYDERMVREQYDERVARGLERISDQLARAERGRRQHDFSVLRLFGALLQMLAIVGALWGTSALVADDSAVATARLGLACFLQLASLSAFAIDRFR